MQKPPLYETQVFDRLPPAEQIAALHGMITYLRGEQAADKKKMLEQGDIIKAVASAQEYIKGELQGMGIRSQKQDVFSTTEKLQNLLTKNSAAWIWYRDHVLSGTLTAIQTAIILAVLYLAFGGKLTP